MKGRVIEDLHGNVFKIHDQYTLSAEYPKEKIYDERDRVLTNDLLSNSSFILIRPKLDNLSFGYIFYANDVYILGLMTKTGYNSKNDIRYVKK